MNKAIAQDDRGVGTQRVKVLALWTCVGLALMSCESGSSVAAPVDADPTKEFTNSIGMELIYLSAGYYVSRYETTQRQFAEIMGYNPSFYADPNHPVENVLAAEATEFCVRLTERERRDGKLPEGFAYALPTFKQYLQYRGDAPVSGSVSPYGGNRKWREEQSAPVGSGERNRLGLYDIVGNIQEFTADVDKGGGRLVTGGSFASHLKDPYEYPEIEMALRGADGRGFNLGFRCVLIRTIDPQWLATDDGALHKAAIIGDVDAAKAALDRGEAANDRNRWGDPAVNLAIRHGHLEFAGLLIDAKADLDVSSAHGLSPLLLAVEARDANAVAFLTERGARVNQRSKNGWLPLQAAVENRMAGTAELLIRQGADVNARGADGWTPLLAAIDTGREDLVRMLLDAGADINLCGGVSSDWSPLSRAKSKNRRKIAELLRRKGARE